MGVRGRVNDRIANGWPEGVVRQRVALLFLIGLSCFIAFARFHTYNEPLDHDITATAVIASEMRAGRSYYSDLWENKPPAIYVAHIIAQSLFGYGRGSIYALNVGLGVITLFGVYVAASAMGMGTTAGLWAAVFWTLTSGDLDLQANQPNKEAFMNAALIWAFALLLRARRAEIGTDHSHLLRTLAIGGLLALATFYKPQTVLYSFFLAVAHVIYPPERTPSGRKQALKEVSIIAAVGAAAWLAFFAYFAMTGRFKIVYTTMFIYPSHYSGNMFKNLWTSLAMSNLYPKQMQFTAALVFLSLLGGIIAWAKRSARQWAMLLAYAVATQLTIGITGKFYPHYYQLWLPILAVGAGWSVVLLSHVIKQKDAAWRQHVFAVIALVSMLPSELWVYRMDSELWALRAYGDVHVNSERLGREINNILEPGETLYVLGDEPGFYFVTKRRPPTGVFFLQALAGGPLAQELTTRVVNDLVRKPPDLVVIMSDAVDTKTVSSDHATLGPDHPLRMWVLQNYHCPPGKEGHKFFSLCARPGSPLDQRASYRNLASLL